MADEKIQMPSSGGGLVRYFEDYKSKLQFKPHYVIAFILIVVIIELILFRVGSRFLS
ncbi:MAG: preprotein translocase subunit Sec61beta [Candidatus Nanoarchaeia archaeon]|jgi:preprotein translocase subunit Sec61beta|nr:preprotein translocase subunit Sec61beta [Candidatus Nanoarchaeia archaeon]|tara:strand:+ start:15068 stop:15238 length:171 start_codon:yes stop_codon:yes gene_type:complete